MNLDDKIELLGEIFQADPPAEGDQEALLAAVGQTFHCLAAQGEDPENDKWLTNRDLFLRVVKPLIAEHWRENAGDEREEFPWQDDYLVRVWLEWRELPDWKPCSCSCVPASKAPAREGP